MVGNPYALAEGTVAAQLESLLSGLNDHTNRQNEVSHVASAISVADAEERLNATDVEGALSEIVDTFDGDHFPGNEETAGQHRTIRQPSLGGSKALLWDAQGVGGDGSRLRMYSDTESVWFTLNASWDGEQWERDSIYYSCGGFRLARGAVEFLHDTSGDQTFTTWSNRWKLPMGSTVNSAFETTGSIREVGRVGLHGMNTHDAQRTMELGGVVTFRSRFSTPPSSITFNVSESSNNWSGTPTPVSIDRDGFGYVHSQRVAADTAVWWFGTYTAIA